MFFFGISRLYPKKNMCGFLSLQQIIVIYNDTKSINIKNRKKLFLYRSQCRFYLVASEAAASG